MSINYWMSGLEVQYNTQYCSHCGEAGLAHYHLLKRDQVSEVGGGGAERVRLLEIVATN